MSFYKIWFGQMNGAEFAITLWVNAYNGFIDDFALWTRTLSHDEVKRIYEAGRKGLAIADML